MNIKKENNRGKGKIIDETVVSGKLSIQLQQMSDDRQPWPPALLATGLTNQRGQLFLQHYWQVSALWADFEM